MGVRDRLRAAQRRDFRFRSPETGAASAQADQLGLLLGVVDGGARGVTLELWQPGVKLRGGVALAGEALEAWDRAQAAARRFAPVVLGSRPRRRAPLVRGPSGVHVVSGPSYGLSFTLPSVADLVGEALPSDAVATAAVDAYGGLHRVDGLGAKVRALLAETEGTHRLFVAAEQRAEAEAVIADLGAAARVVVVGCRDVREASATLFPDLWERLALRWQEEPDGAADVARRLLISMVRSGANFVSLEACVNMASRLEASLAERGRPEAWFALAAGTIARRYQGLRVEPIEVPAQLPLHRRLRMELLPHQIQACTERGDEDWRVQRERWLCQIALRQIPESDPEGLRVHGALARLRASWGEVREALQDLVAIAEAWIELDLAGEVSHAVCEALRLAALLGDEDAFGRADAAMRAGRDLAPAVSRAYMALSRARAASLRGEDGLVFLADEAEPWAQCGLRVEAQRTRLRVMALCDRGEVEDARVAAAQLDALGAGGAAATDLEVQRAFAAAYLSLAEGGGDGPAEAVLRRLCAAEIRRLRSWMPGVEEDVRALLRWLRI